MNKEDLWNVLKKFFLFCSSYSPLFIITIILKFSSDTLNFCHWILISASLLFIIIGYVLLYLIISNPSTGPFTPTVDTVENKNDLMHTYLLPYIVFILSFIGNTSLNIYQVLAMGIFIGLLFIIYCKSDLLLLDVILISFGYNYYKVTSEHKELIIITKNNLYNKKGKPIKTKQILDNVFIYKGAD